ncbi:MAG: hypothetical protein A3K83_03290 [Omnitrophica WOR_2 bacterium RBG_13_44_8b]|nr:MAG: hypothetical protein A3K83_03290 [Omnitrophica WOR_2 bacterium RBG_13_44_8b]
MDTQFDFKKRLREGRFGEVWLANDIGLNAECAVKCIPPDKVVNQHNFFHEAHILKTAQHTNIIKVLGSGKLNDGRIFVAMEFLKKGSLEDESMGAYIPLTRARQIMIDVLRGLEHAHSKDIIHRDIKPANILIGDSGEGKLSDFGLAVCGVKHLQPDAIKDYKYRMHLAPEVKSLNDYSYMSDIYACGVTLYRLVNGDSYIRTIPFERFKEEAEKGTFPDRNSYREFVPKSLKLIINKALSINSILRFKSAKEMRRALEQVKIHMNWNEQLFLDRIKWSASWGNKCYIVERIRIDPNRWQIITRKGSSKHSLRSIKKYCFKALSERESIKKTSKILQDFVNGKSV